MGCKTAFPRLDEVPRTWSIEKTTSHPLLIQFLDEIQKAVDNKLVHHQIIQYQGFFAGYITVSGKNKDKIAILMKHIIRTYPWIETAPSPTSDYSFMYKYRDPHEKRSKST